MRDWRPVVTVVLFMACTLNACTPFASTPATSTSASTSTPDSTPTIRLPAAPAPTLPSSPSPSPAATHPAATSLPPAPNLCSPLEGISLEELTQPDLLKNPFDPPRPGMDGGHQGVDFAYWSRGERKTMLGLPIQAVLSGQVSAALPLRQPYGYAVIIETALSDLPAGWLANALIPTPAPTVPPAPNLYCPPGGETEGLPIGPFPTGYSLYLLYAHLDQPPSVKTSQAVTCGQMIGAAGTTGNSVNIHLHFETRLGPSGAVFSSMGHYENDATDLEMSNYCTWRVSGLFQLFDPLQLLSLQP